MQIDEKLPLSKYLKLSLYTIDGFIFILICVMSLLCLMDLYIFGGVFPLAHSKNLGKATVLICFSPLIIFLVMIFLRVASFGSNKNMGIVRASIGIMLFLIFNF